MRRINQFCCAALLGLLVNGCKPDCSHHKLTDEENSFLPFESGMTALFENDSSGQVETLTMHEKRYWEMEIDGCRGTRYAAYQETNFYPITQEYSYGLTIRVDHHHEAPEIDYAGAFNMAVPAQTLTVNSITYYDVYSAERDTTSVYYQVAGPWKVDYSKTQGFVRIHMLNGVHWNRK